jgi:acyl carrier protein
MADDQNIDLAGRQPNLCPLCGRTVPVDPSDYFGDARCPSCGESLFFVRLGRAAMFYGYPGAARMRERLVNVIAIQLGVDKDKVTPKTSFIADLGADSLDLVGLVMELEEESDQR